jgi:hypothetical protein
MREMMDLDVWRQRREEMVREAEQIRLAKVLQAGRKTRGSRLFRLTWQLRRGGGVLLKFAKARMKKIKEESS